jgi:hypothetical protein
MISGPSDWCIKCQHLLNLPAQERMEHLKQEGLAQVAIDKFTGGEVTF